MSRKQRKLYAIGLVLAGMITATVLVLTALEDSITLFYSPSEITSGTAVIPEDRPFRLGGMVVEGSVQKSGTTLRFTVSDTVAVMNVEYEGIVPNLFAENQGVVALGRMNEDGVFVAKEILAKHDENYMPPEVARALEKNENIRLPKKYRSSDKNP